MKSPKNLGKTLKIILPKSLRFERANHLKNKQPHWQYFSTKEVLSSTFSSKLEIE
jgi:hypothetical protein